MNDNKKKKPKPSCPQIKYTPFLKEDAYVESLNCLELPLHKVKYILGPCSFFQFKVGSRNVYLFGEGHGNLSRSIGLLAKGRATRRNTLLFSSFVHSLAVQNPENTYDLMFEGIYFLQKPYDGSKPFFTTKSTSQMSNHISSQFEYCIIPFTRPGFCPYENLRIHYVDYRRTEADPTKNLTREEMQKNVKDLISKPGKVLKQIENIKNRKIRDALLRFLNDEIDKNPLAGYVKMIVMDAYALARLFRDFDTKTKKSGSFSGTSENVIYYAGSQHVMTAVRFLVDYLGLKPQVEIGECHPPIQDPESLLKVKIEDLRSFVKIDMTKTSFL